MGWLVWNPDRVLFTIPVIDMPVMVYGALFSLGFLISYVIFIYILQQEFLRRNLLSSSLEARTKARNLVDSLVWYTVIATLIGARLGNVLFYDFDYFLSNPLQVFNIRQGGLASHGGAIAILLALALYIYRKKSLLPTKSYLEFLDLFVIVVPIAGFCIRLGNFFNQEIVGTPTEVPWAVIFAHPIDAKEIVPRHPVQLYEGFAYLLIFVILFSLWIKWGKKLKMGTLSGLFFILLFTARFVLEFYKVNQTPETYFNLQMGQILSLPFIIVGIALLIQGNAICTEKRRKG